MKSILHVKICFLTVKCFKKSQTYLSGIHLQIIALSKDNRVLFYFHFYIQYTKLKINDNYKL